jgi:hypothetical protein
MSANTVLTAGDEATAEQTAIAQAAVQALSTRGEQLLPAADLSQLIGVTPGGWARFARYWDDLKIDTFMADGGTYRYRRYGQYELDPDSGELTPLPHEPYRQERFFNPLNGGVDRIYEPLTDDFTGDPLLRELLVSLGRIFSAVDKTQRWLIKLHPVRIIAGSVMGQPAPEGLHRDGVTFVGSLLIDRLNITGGQSSVYTADGELLRTVTLSQRGDLLIGDDQRTLHEVTPIHAVDADQSAHRDVLVLNYCSLPAKLR